MAKGTSLSVNIYVSIPEETARRCARILELWLEDDSRRDLFVEVIPTESGFHKRVRLQSGEPRGDGNG
jgi:hypothetical protein